MEMLQLQAFISLAKTLHMPRTAQEINTTQSHVSKLISSLEAELGVRLFDRVGRRLVLNDSGKLYYKYISDSLQLMSNGESAVKSLRGTLTGTIRIGVYAFPSILHPCIREFSAKYPQINFYFSEVRQSDTGLLMDMTDLMLHSSSGEDNPLLRSFPVCRELFSEKSYLLISPKLVRFPAQKKSVSLSEIARYPLIESQPSPFYQDAFLWNQTAYASRNILGTTLRIGFVPTDFFSKISLLDEGVGIAFLPEVCLEPALRFAPDLQVLSLRGYDMTRRVQISRKLRSQMPVAALAFWDFLLDYFNLEADKEET